MLVLTFDGVADWREAATVSTSGEADEAAEPGEGMSNSRSDAVSQLVSTVVYYCGVIGKNLLLCALCTFVQACLWRAVHSVTSILSLPVSSRLRSAYSIL